MLREPSRTWPGAVRHSSGVAVGVSVAVEVGGGGGVIDGNSGAGVGVSDEEQAAVPRARKMTK